MPPCPALRDLGLMSRALYNDLAKIEGMNFAFEEKGLMMLCKNQHTFDEEAEVAIKANELGITAKVLTKTQLHELEPEVKPEVAGAVFFPGDAHLFPNIFVKQLKQLLDNKGVKFLYNTEVTGFEIEKDRIKAVKFQQSGVGLDNKKTHHSSLITHHLIIATGSWSPILTKNIESKFAHARR